MTKVYEVTDKQLTNGNSLSPEAQTIYNIIKDNNREGIKVCYIVIWDILQEDNNHNIKFNEMVTYIKDMENIGLLKS